MNSADPPFVGCAQGPGDLDRVGDRLRNLQRPVPADQALERFPVDVFQDQVIRVLELTEFIDPDNVRIRDAAGRETLEAKPIDGVS